jgi:ABC-type nitrate/sulfonate/bicarbonate transport system substrate-binding protein
VSRVTATLGEVCAGKIPCKIDRVGVIAIHEMGMIMTCGSAMRIFCATTALLVACCGPVWAADVLHVGKPSPQSFSFVPLNVAIDTGIFKKNDLDVRIVGFSGGTKLHQALVSDAIDIGFGSGPQMILTARGSPMMAVAEMAGAPLIFAMIVPYDSPIKSLDGLKGTKIGVSGIPSLSSFMAEELALKKGWGPKGITPVGIGGMNYGVIAALRTHQVDAVTFDLRVGLQLEQTKEGRVLAPCSDYVTHFITHAIFAQNDMIKNKPDVLRRFLKSWFETIAYMQHNKDQSVAIASKITGATATLESLEYDRLMPHFFSANGYFQKDDLAAVGESLVMLKNTDKVPDMSKLYTEAFLPK